MGLTPEAHRRGEILQQMSWAFGTLRSAINVVNIGESIPQCATPVEVNTANALRQIQRLRDSLDEIQALLNTEHKNV